MPGLLDWPFVSFEFRLHDLYTLLKVQGDLLEAVASAHRRMPRVHLLFSNATPERNAVQVEHRAGFEPA